MAAKLPDSALNYDEWIDLCSTAHGPFVFRADGLLSCLVDGLKKLAAKDIHEPCPILQLVCAVCNDIDCALEFGMRGGHSQLQRLLTQAAMLPEQESDDFTHPMELLADTIGACSQALPEGYSFPVSPTLPDAYEHVPAMFVFDGSDPSNTAGDISQETNTKLYLLVRQEWSKRMESQADVGQVLWPAAEIMSRWAASGVCSQWQRRGYKSVLELGAGMGLTGLLIAHYMPQVVLTDFNPVVLRNLHYNAVLNTVHQGTQEAQPRSQDTGTARALPSVFPKEHTVLVRRLDWSLPNSRDPPLSAVREALPPLPAGSSGPQGSRVQSTEWGADLHPDLDGCDSFDVIIGSDMICCREDAEHVAKAVSQWLSASGTAYFMLPPSRVRWGVQFFQPAAEALGLQVTSEVVDKTLVADIVQRPSDTTKDALRNVEMPTEHSSSGMAAEDGQARVATGGGVYETELRVYTVVWK